MTGAEPPTVDWDVALATNTQTFPHRTQFLVELARRLHMAGLSSQRIEGAIVSTGRLLRLDAEIWSTPTGLLLSIADPESPDSGQVTRVLRLHPGDLDLKALCEVDAIAEQVTGGTLSLPDGLTALRNVARPRTAQRRLATVLAFGLAAGSVTGLLQTGWVDILVATMLGLVAGVLVFVMSSRPAMAEASEALVALVVTFGAIVVATFVVPLAFQTVVVAALIVLMPGLTLTTAVSELAAQHLASGTSRAAGALMTLLKLTFGSIAASEIAAALGWTPRLAPPGDLPVAVEVAALAVAAFAFAVLFRAARRDVPLVMASAALGYALTRVGSAYLGLSSGAFPSAVFFASFAMAALGNLYGRWRHRPGALVRVPGIMLLVPGSVGFRGLSLVMERDYAVGLETGVAVLSALTALVAGLLFGSLVVPPRRYL